MSQLSTGQGGFVRAENASVVRFRQGVGEAGITGGWTTAATRITGLAVNVTTYFDGSLPTTLGFGTYSTVIDAAYMEHAEANSVSTLISNHVGYYEVGTLTPFGIDASAAQEWTGTAGSPALVAGQRELNPTHSRHVRYDDLYLDCRTDTDVDGTVAFPLETRIYGFVPTAQGASNDFAPAGAYARLTEIPPGADLAANEISSATLNAQTTYAHAPLADPVGTVAHVRAKLNAVSPGALATHAILLDGVAYARALAGVLSTVYADPVLVDPIDAATFLAMPFGVKQGAAGDALRVNALLLEALMFRNPPTVTGVSPKRGPIVGGTRVTITGTSFSSAGTLSATIAGLPMIDVVVVDNGHITATTPPHALGWTDIVVDMGAQGGAGTLAHAFKYIDTYILNLRRQASDLSIHDQLGDAPTAATFTVDTFADVPQGKQEVLIYINDDTLLLFAGIIQTVTEEFEEQHDALKWTCAAIDYLDRLNKRYPFGHWDATSVSTIVAALFAAYAPTFTLTGLQPDLPAVTVTYDGTVPLGGVLTNLVTQMGGGGWFLDGTDLWFFQDITFSNPPDPLDAANTTLLRDPPLTHNEDWTQIRNRILLTGAGGNAVEDVPITATQIAMDTVAAFADLGGLAVGRGQVFSYAARQVGGASLVGPGVGAAAPRVVLRIGVGIETGEHAWALTFLTTDGETMVGDKAVALVGWTQPPSIGPTNAQRAYGTNLGIGRYQYAIAYQTPNGETTLSPLAISYNGFIPQTGVDTLGGIAGPSGGGGGGGGGTDLISQMVAAYGASSNWNALRPATVDSASTPLLHDMAATYGSLATVPPPNWNALRPLSGGGGASSVSADGTFKWVRDSPYTWSGNTPGGIGGGFSIVDNLTPGDTVSFVYTYHDGATVLIGAESSASQPVTFGFAADFSGSFQGLYSPDPRTVLVHIWASRNGDGYRLMYGNSTVNRLPGHYEYESTQYKPRGWFRWSGGSKARLNVLLSDQLPSQQQAVTMSFPITLSGDVTAINLYRSAVNQTAPLKRVAALAPGTVVYTDTLADGSLGVTAPTTNTAGGANKAEVTIALGPSPKTTGRDLWRTVVDSPDLLLEQTIADNTTTLVIDTTPDASLTATTPPLGDTSGLPIITGQVAAGSTSMLVSNPKAFNLTGGGTVRVGDVTIRYAGLTGNRITGIPPTGTGSIATAIAFGTPMVVTPMLLGVAGLRYPFQMNSGAADGTRISIFRIVEDLDAQINLGLHELDDNDDPTDGVREFPISDGALMSDAQLQQRGEAELALFARPIISVNYSTRDTKTRAGKSVHGDLEADVPGSGIFDPDIFDPVIFDVVTGAGGLFGDFLIQDVTIDQIHVDDYTLSPRYRVSASSVRFTLEDLLRRIPLR